MKIVSKLVFTISFLLILPLINLHKETHVSKLYAQPSEAGASRFNITAKTILSPAYSYLAEYIVNRFNIQDQRGIGIDIGGGPGDLILELCKKTSAFFWINVDINTYFSQYFFISAHEEQFTHRIGFLFADVHFLPFRDNYADIVVSRGSLQFWYDKEQAFTEIYRILKPGGQALIGRGFSENMPLEIARSIRKKQGDNLPKYNPEDTAKELEKIMKKLLITGYEILKPRADQNLVNYGVWIVFSKPMTH